MLPLPTELAWTISTLFLLAGESVTLNWVWMPGWIDTATAAQIAAQFAAEYLELGGLAINDEI